MVDLAEQEMKQEMISMLETNEQRRMVPIPIKLHQQNMPVRFNS
jgi:hypothetical protein